MFIHNYNNYMYILTCVHVYLPMYISTYMYLSTHYYIFIDACVHTMIKLCAYIHTNYLHTYTNIHAYIIYLYTNLSLCIHKGLSLIIYKDFSESCNFYIISYHSIIIMFLLLELFQYFTKPDGTRGEFIEWLSNIIIMCIESTSITLCVYAYVHMCVCLYVYVFVCLCVTLYVHLVNIMEWFILLYYYMCVLFDITKLTNLTVTEINDNYTYTVLYTQTRRNIISNFTIEMFQAWLISEINQHLIKREWIGSMHNQLDMDVYCKKFLKVCN